MYWSAFTLAFFGYLRVSECASTSQSTETTLRLEDVTLSPGGIELKLRKSKTDQFQHGYRTGITPTRRSVCAARALQRYLSTRVDKHPGEPLCVFSNGQALRRSDVNSCLQQMLRTHPDRKRISTH